MTGPFTSHPENSIATTSNSEQTGVSSSRSSIEPANTANPSSPNASPSSPWINRQLSRFSPAGDQPASAATLLEARKIERIFLPNMDSKVRAHMLSRWHEAVDRSRRWESPHGDGLTPA